MTIRSLQQTCLLGSKNGDFRSCQHTCKAIEWRRQTTGFCRFFCFEVSKNVSQQNCSLKDLVQILAINDQSMRGGKYPGGHRAPCFLVLDPQMHPQIYLDD